METRTERFETGSGMYVNATVVHDNQECTAGGGYVTQHIVYAYLSPSSPNSGRGMLTLWDGEIIGSYHTVSTWKQYGAHLGHYTMRSVRAYVSTGNLAPAYYHGRLNDDWSQLIALRPVKSA